MTRDFCCANLYTSVVTDRLLFATADRLTDRRTIETSLPSHFCSVLTNVTTHRAHGENWQVTSVTLATSIH